MIDIVVQEFLDSEKVTATFVVNAKVVNCRPVLTEPAPVVIVSTGSEIMFTYQIVFAKHHYH